MSSKMGDGMQLVVLWSIIIGLVFGGIGYLILPSLIVLGPAAFIISLLVFEKVWKESEVKRRTNDTVF